jgi:hypothetical protein
VKIVLATPVRSIAMRPSRPLRRDSKGIATKIGASARVSSAVGRTRGPAAHDTYSGQNGRWVPMMNATQLLASTSGSRWARNLRTAPKLTRYGMEIPTIIGHLIA